MSKTIDYFKELTTIERCSGNREPFISFIQAFASKHNYTAEIDAVGNILCKKSDSANLVLQAHYDIVCINDNRVTIVEEDGFYRAKESTLGADNGVGCAMMMTLMEEGADVELLFTSDEEIGLIGANGLELQLNATKMLNLDTEEIGAVYIGCAGGIDVEASKQIEMTASNQKYFYRATADNLPGGHSGVDIDKDIPNAFKEVIALLPDDALIGKIEGGERINSIPKRAMVEFSSDELLIPNDNIRVLKTPFKVFPCELKEHIENFDNGVLELNDELGVVHTSQNLAIIKSDGGEIIMKTSLRSMDSDDLMNQEHTTRRYFENRGYMTQAHDKYPAWRPDINVFTTSVKEIYQNYFSDVKLEAIHAGLECAIFKQKFPTMQITSIGPNIFSPHSFSERVEISTIETFEKIVKEIVNVYAR
jgi:dipeptidase D